MSVKKAVSNVTSSCFIGTQVKNQFRAARIMTQKPRPDMTYNYTYLHVVVTMTTTTINNVYNTYYIVHEEIPIQDRNVPCFLRLCTEFGVAMETIIHFVSLFNQLSLLVSLTCSKIYSIMSFLT